MSAIETDACELPEPAPAPGTTYTCPECTQLWFVRGDGTWWPR